MLTPGRWRWARRAAITVAVLVWAGWVGGYVIGGGTFNSWGQLLSADHLAFYTAARLVADGRAGEIYDHQIVAAYQAGLFPPGRWESLEAFRNPPFYALLYRPTARLPFAASAAVWDTVSLLALAAAVRLLGAGRPWRATGWALTFYPVHCAVSYGQNSLLSLFAFAAAYRLLTLDRRFLAGCVAGLLWFKPPLLLGLVVWGLLEPRRLWPCAAGAAVTGAALAGGTYPILPDAWAGFWGTLGENARFDNFAWWRVHNPRAFWRLLLPWDGWGPARVGLTATCSAAGLVAFWRVWRSRRAELPVLFGAATGLTLWVSPHVLIYEWALAVVPAVLWWERCPDQRNQLRWLFAIMWVTFLAASDFGQAQDWVQGRFGSAEHVVVQVSVPVVAWAGWRLARGFAAPARPDPL